MIKNNPQIIRKVESLYGCICYYGNKKHGPTYIDFNGRIDWQKNGYSHRPKKKPSGFNPRTGVMYWFENGNFIKSE